MSILQSVSCSAQPHGEGNWGHLRHMHPVRFGLECSPWVQSSTLWALRHPPANSTHSPHLQWHAGQLSTPARPPRSSPGQPSASSAWRQREPHGTGPWHSTRNSVGARGKPPDLPWPLIPLHGMQPGRPHGTHLLLHAALQQHGDTGLHWEGDLAPADSQVLLQWLPKGRLLHPRFCEGTGLTGRTLRPPHPRPGLQLRCSASTEVLLQHHNPEFSAQPIQKCLVKVKSTQNAITFPDPNA